jgi:hypothetical protein
MIGSGVGTDDLRTYCERSGTGGHSVLSIYWLISGQTGGGGIDDFRTYLERSGAAGHEFEPHEAHVAGAVFWNPS